MTETRFLARFATIANAAFNSMSANSTAVTAMSIGGHTINSSSMSAATNTFTVGTAAYFVANGNVGIGTSTPIGSLSILDRTAAGAGIFAIDLRSSNSSFESNMSITTYGAQPSGFFVRKAGGSAASPTATTADRLGFIIGSTTPDGNTFFNTAAINIWADAIANSTSQPTSIRFDTTAVGATIRTERLRITANGDIGIGTTSPGTKVDIYDAASAGNPALRIRDNVSDLRLYPSGGGSYVATISNTPLVFNTNNTERMRITEGGNVGLGTSSIDSRLTIQDAGAGQISMKNSSGTTQAYIMTNAAIGSAPTDALRIRGDTGIALGTLGQLAMFINTSQNVGIGTTSPLARLDVVSSDRKRIRATGAAEEGVIIFQNGTTGSGQNNGLLVGIGGDSNAYVLNYHNSPIIFSTNGAERARLTPDGHFVPGATNTYDLGSSSLRWRNIFTNDLNLSNGIGDYTIVEGEDDLFLYNNKKGKVYKFALIEVNPEEAPEKAKS